MITDDDRRNFMRLSTDTTASITRPGNPSAHDVKLVDLSASGCAFYAATHLQAGDELDFLVRGASKSLEPLVRRGHVLRVSEDDRGNLVAFEFDAED